MKSDPPVLGSRGRVGKGLTTSPGVGGIEGSRRSALKVREDGGNIGKKVPLNHLSPRGLVGFWDCDEG